MLKFTLELSDRMQEPNGSLYVIFIQNLKKEPFVMEKSNF